MVSPAQASVNLTELVAGAGDAIMVCDAQGAITLWNGAAERIFGHSAAACGSVSENTSDKMPTYSAASATR